MAWVSEVSARLSRRLRQATCSGCDSTLSPWLACDGISAYENALSSRYERVSPSFARKPCTRCPASPTRVRAAMRSVAPGSEATRSEEHTSELQSLMRISYAVFCLTKKTTNISTNTNNYIYHTKK